MATQSAAGLRRCARYDMGDGGVMVGYTPRHPELVSGSIVPQVKSVPVKRWMLKQVQHDRYFGEMGRW